MESIKSHTDYHGSLMSLATLQSALIENVNQNSNKANSQMNFLITGLANSGKSYLAALMISMITDHFNVNLYTIRCIDIKSFSSYHGSRYMLNIGRIKPSIKNEEGKLVINILDGQTDNIFELINNLPQLVIIVVHPDITLFRRANYAKLNSANLSDLYPADYILGISKSVSFSSVQIEYKLRDNSRILSSLIFEREDARIWHAMIPYFK